MTEKAVTDCQTKQFQLCPKFQKTFTILGKKWNGLIVDVLLEEGTQRFKDLAQKVPKCSDRVLVERLKELELEGIVERRTYADSALIEYALTEQGQDLKQVMDAVHGWADTWLDAEECVKELA
ncbi:helix-turn-helix transcriptional regulator [Loigolactobacillus coryniformis]|jgi:DNA-binding HxlR family transcriptional regulator|uniref:HxlR family transcriptional regulator n=1 Tax=Loigolactobacillus coryniformis subsp. torquens DSM 20004 = KCTC 3535 TaxID=1423822 RepID=A0A2D1KPM9_9LACO|nr:helix-turn-helix domain-containing protein [Loigolactobacillus coryniformis]MDT3390909.1 helix-turn-helix transcriptional regulator [Bacillota bacterium]RRG06836.1 MAG: transcriptional regulator [Lactobacillus sp.]ATO44029.1 HxlR family transcriptional regulator [Loigolactobacillus coryniformis subsp. torquens DSM 20004 = KCTC 3535]KRK71656.1 MarR family transcriptional regulator [Loigolactobacillus coryniformis subsp. torquens DSM 20004 = KCTC 3535]MBW4802718.1 helix-turn-helix transcripti